MYKKMYTRITELLFFVGENFKISKAGVHHRPYFRDPTTQAIKNVDFELREEEVQNQPRRLTSWFEDSFLQIITPLSRLLRSTVTTEEVIRVISA